MFSPARSPLRRYGIFFTFALAVPATSVAQIDDAATPRVGAVSGAEARPKAQVMGPPAPPPVVAPRTGPLPSSLTLDQALEEAASRSPAIVAARAEVDAARARVGQAGVRSNPELSVEVENFAGTGPYSGISGTETTVSINQRLDLGGRRRARVSAAEARLAAQELRLAIAEADLAQSVREQFAVAVAARERLRLARENEERARELARIAGVLVDVGREPPLRAIRARSAAAQATAALRAAEAAEEAARRTLASFFGVDTSPSSVLGGLGEIRPAEIVASQTLEARLAAAEIAVAEAGVGQELAARRLDPSVGIGVRRIEETGDQAFVAGFSMPLPIFDRNRGNIEAARAEARSAEARLNNVLAQASARINNAEANLVAADARVEALEEAAIPEAGEALRLAQLAYQAGKIDLIELLDAQEAFASAQTELIEARLARAQAAAALARAAAQ
ncbi:TolC family protein [Sphingosinicella humi]|uniref:TolC family protein n=2 Tax=Allosphingosinicella humi TaxID=2068657 RepID=A0A2U2J0X4_9SPHN|nr:TolC family protein [Sphingosinicella humi]